MQDHTKTDVNTNGSSPLIRRAGTRRYLACKRGHDGWWEQRYIFDKRRNRGSWAWICVECRRISKNASDARLRAQRAKPKPIKSRQMWYALLWRRLYLTEAPY